MGSWSGEYFPNYGRYVGTILHGVTSTFMICSVAPKTCDWISEFADRMVKIYPDSHGMMTPKVSVK